MELIELLKKSKLGRPLTYKEIMLTMQLNGENINTADRQLRSFILHDMVERIEIPLGNRALTLYKLK